MFSPKATRAFFSPEITAIPEKKIPSPLELCVLRLIAGIHRYGAFAPSTLDLGDITPDAIEQRAEERPKTMETMNPNSHQTHYVPKISPSVYTHARPSFTHVSHIAFHKTRKTLTKTQAQDVC